VKYRTEAAAIPTLLVAPKATHTDGIDRSIYDSGLGDTRGFYENGAYTAAPLHVADTADISSINASLRDPQAVYFDKILERFEKLRQQLSLPAPPSVVEQLDNDHSSHMSPSPVDYRKWRWRIASTEPLSAQLAGMDKGTIFRLLRLITTGKGLLGGQKVGISGRTSRWIWGLLARAPERGELSSEEVGVVRDLGKRAVWIGVAMKGVDTSGLDDGQAADEEEEILDTEIVGEDEAGDNENAEEPQNIIGPALPQETAVPTEDYSMDETTEDLTAARERLLAKLTSPNDEVNIEPEVEAEIEAVKETEEIIEDNTAADHSNAKVTIDMILTVAGEVYGQRDLLEFREPWE
jgi:hypothetical protein